MNKTKLKPTNKPQMEISVSYEQASPEDTRTIIRLFAEMLRIYIEKQKVMKAGEVVL